ncbi:hypothetical protein [Dyella japonica]|uniref:Uncharacterized protein n=1 Tax=Dyella japonica TaxID=231455 RepID=A0ABV2JUF4_9GAMM
MRQNAVDAAAFELRETMRRTTNLKTALKARLLQKDGQGLHARLVARELGRQQAKGRVDNLDQGVSGRDRERQRHNRQRAARAGNG